MKPSRVDFCFKQLRMTLTDGTIVPVYGEIGTYLIHETGATIHASNKKQAARLSHHISFHKEADLKKEYFDFSLDKTLLQQGEGYVGRTMPPQTQSTAQPSSEPAGSSGPQLFRNDHRNDTTVVQVHLLFFCSRNCCLCAVHQSVKELRHARSKGKQETRKTKQQTQPKMLCRCTCASFG